MRLKWPGLVYRAENVLSNRGEQLKVYVKREAKALGWLWLAHTCSYGTQEVLKGSMYGRDSSGTIQLAVAAAAMGHVKTLERQPTPPRVIGQSTKETQAPKPYTNAPWAPVFMRRHLQGGLALGCPLRLCLSPRFVLSCRAIGRLRGFCRLPNVEDCMASRRSVRGLFCTGIPALQHVQVALCSSPPTRHHPSCAHRSIVPKRSATVARS